MKNSNVNFIHYNSFVRSFVLCVRAALVVCALTYLLHSIFIANFGSLAAAYSRATARMQNKNEPELESVTVVLNDAMSGVCKRRGAHTKNQFR